MDIKKPILVYMLVCIVALIFFLNKSNIALWDIRITDRNYPIVYIVFFIIAILLIFYIF